MKFLYVFPVLAALSGVAMGASTLSTAELDRLHTIAAKCDRDNSGVPDTDTCVPVYDKLIRHYGGYTEFVAASKARKPS